MELIISKDANDSVEIRFEDNGKASKADFETSLSMCMTALRAITLNFVEKLDPKDKQLFCEHLYDSMDAMFGQFLMDTFPTVELPDFGLTEAAIIYAQDQIISQAEKEGISYEEMLDKYNDLANAYILKRREAN